MARQVADAETANATHYEAGDHVRTMLQNAGVPTPELLATPKKSYEQLLREQLERERLASQDREGLWAQIRDGALQERSVATGWRASGERIRFRWRT